MHSQMTGSQIQRIALMASGLIPRTLISIFSAVTKAPKRGR